MIDSSGSSRTPGSVPAGGSCAWALQKASRGPVFAWVSFQMGKLDKQTPKGSQVSDTKYAGAAATGIAHSSYSSQRVRCAAVWCVRTCDPCEVRALREHRSGSFRHVSHANEADVPRRHGGNFPALQAAPPGPLFARNKHANMTRCTFNFSTKEKTC